LPATNAKRLCKGAIATKQSSRFVLDCFAGARNDGWTYRTRGGFFASSIAIAEISGFMK
jgi:hypothetical protein